MSIQSKQRQRELAASKPSHLGVLMILRRRYLRLLGAATIVVLIAMVFYGARKRGKSIALDDTSHAKPARFSPSISQGTVKNGDFEAATTAPWYALNNIQWGSFFRGDETPSNSERVNHYATVRAEVAAVPTSIKVFGAVQEIHLTAGVPDQWNFLMRVVEENKLCQKQYAQAVAIFWPGDEEQPGVGNVQLRCILHGLEAPPYQMGNARFQMNPTFTTNAAGWRQYELPLRQWFEEAYPDQDFSNGRMRILLEARYDDMPATAQASALALEVNYDDVHFIWKGGRNG